MRKLVLMTAALAAISTGAVAKRYHYDQGDYRGSVTERQHRQQERIELGLRNGTISHTEARKLENEQHSIERAIEKAERDGTVSRKERMRIQKMQDTASSHIAREARDRNHAY